MSRGSIYECVDHIYCCLDENIIKEEEFKELYNHSQCCLRILNGYIKYLRSRKNEM
ncbi:MAG: four helix bundle protein [Bacteroidota bacterium]|nr:four helix bundle protein [Bacteroidota bacterium]